MTRQSLSRSMGLACLGLAWRPRSDRSWRRAVPGGARALRPVLGLGIAVPALVPPVWQRSPRCCWPPPPRRRSPISLGASAPLIGGDLLHLGGLCDLGAGVASIGGAGTFDGVVLSGIMAVALVGLT